MNGRSEADARLDEILERAAAFYESFLWDSDEAEAIRSRLAGLDLGAQTLRSFRVGYAPGGWDRLLLRHLERWRYSPAELRAAGIAERSRQGQRLYDRFRSRIMFPIGDPRGRILGFAGLAINPGPSWPQWLTSPESSRYRRGSAIFGIDQAGGAIARAGQALVLSDCVEVLRLHEQGRREAVAVIRSNITRDHLGKLAAVLMVDAAEVSLDRLHGKERGLDGSVVVGVPTHRVDDALLARGGVGEGAIADAGLERGDRESQRAGAANRISGSGIVPDSDESPTRRARVLLYLGSASIGIGIPVGWIGIVGTDSDAAGAAGSPLGIALGGVAVSYVLLTILVSPVSGRSRARSRGRRMRQPWERGLTEWQPSGWTYHLLEEALIGAALVSVVTCLVLLLTVGGFAGGG